jgi:hypothetical protein
MMTQQLEVSILAAPVAAVDPRALSQAWYSALRLARDRRQTSPVRQPSTNAGEAAYSRGVSQQNGQRSFVPNMQALCRRFPRPALSICSGSDEESAVARSRAPRTTLAQRIERAFSNPNGYPRRATLSMGRGNARVVVIFQMQGKRGILLALCRPELRAIVGRALAEARLGLAARGIGIELYAGGGRGCS